MEIKSLREIFYRIDYICIVLGVFINEIGNGIRKRYRIIRYVLYGKVFMVKIIFFVGFLEFR